MSILEGESGVTSVKIKRMGTVTTGARVRELRRQRGLTQDALVERVRAYAEGRPVAKESLSRIENDRQRPGAWMLEALAQALDTTTDYLMGLAEDPGVSVPDLPVPALDLAPLVARLNGLPRERRALVVQLVETALRLSEGAASQSPAVIPFEDFDLLFAGMERSARARLVQELLARAGLRVEDLLLPSTEQPSSAPPRPGRTGGNRQTG